MTLPRQASLATRAGLPAVAPKTNGAPTINSAHADAAKLSAQKWDARVAELIAPTIIRPALTTQAEADNIRRRFQTPEGALAVLEERANERLAWLAARDGFPPETPLDPAKAEAAAQFFAVNGERTDDPDVPVAPAPKTASAPATPPAQTPKPTPAPAPSNPAMLEISYTSAAGFECCLTLSAPTGPAVLESARVAEERLLKFGAKPRTTAAHSAAQATGGAGSDDTPICAVHHTPMVKKSKDGRSWWSCNQKLTAEQAALLGLQEGAWCQYRPKK